MMAWLNTRVKVKSRSQLINKLMVVCNGMTLVLTFGSHYGPLANTKANYHKQSQTSINPTAKAMSPMMTTLSLNTIMRE